jgi:Flp pilus assembly protein TadG
MPLRVVTRSARERGAAMVEFAIVLPILVTMVLGIFSAGVTYNRKNSLANAAREASRYGATLPVSSFPTINAWLAAVADVAQKNGTGDLDANAPGLRICVGYVHPSGGLTNDMTTTLARTSSGDSFSSTPCYADARPDGDERRVDVQVERSSTIEALVFTQSVRLVSASTTHFEAS